MEVVHPSLASLFMQLGLPASDASIAAFIKTHRLPLSTRLPEASYWTPSQAAFLKECWREDADWAVVIEDLNERLH